MLDANEHAATKNMRPYFEIVRHRRKTRTNGSPGASPIYAFLEPTSSTSPKSRLVIGQKSERSQNTPTDNFSEWREVNDQIPK